MPQEVGTMIRGLFVTGTDTGVGKTVVSAALLARYCPTVALRYWKPIQTGIEQDDDTEEIRRLTAPSLAEILDDGIRLPNPVSPHLAAKMAQKTIDVAALTATVGHYPAQDRWIVEGAGGVLVPLNTSAMMIDLIEALGLAVLVVSRSTLGTINHTLLTLKCLRARSLSVAGVVMVGEANPDNRAAIENYGQITVVGEMPRFQSMSAAELTAWAPSNLDPNGSLWEWLK